MFIVFGSVGIIFFVLSAYWKFVSKSFALMASVFIIAPCFLGWAISQESAKSAPVTFYGAELQATIGVYCLDNVVNYRVKDSCHRRDYPLQIFNDNALNGVMSQKIFCENTDNSNSVFKDDKGKVLDNLTVLQTVINNVNTGAIPELFNKTTCP